MKTIPKFQRLLTYANMKLANVLFVIIKKSSAIILIYTLIAISPSLARKNLNNPANTFICMPCISDSDCSGTTPLCDQANNICVECLSNSDCFGPTSVCDQANKICVECVSDSDCDDGIFCNGVETCDLATNTCMPGAPPCAGASLCDEANDVCVECLGDSDCSGSTPFCDLANNVCVECLSDSDCDDGITCNGNETCDLATNTCIPGTPLCSGATPFCDVVNDVCVECLSDSDCDDGIACNGVETCDLVTNTCIPGTPVCSGSTPVCDQANDVCVGCLNDSDCDEGEICVNGICTPISFQDGIYTGSGIVPSNTTAVITDILNFDGDIALSGSMFGLSDARLKADIENVTHALNLLSQLNPSTYKFNTNKYTNLNLPTDQQYGLIAQEVESVFPELVKTIKFEPSGETYKSINYTALISIIIAGVNEQNEKIAKQQIQIDKIKERLKRIE